MLAQEIQAAAPGQRRVIIVIARTSGIGERMICLVPVSGIRLPGLFHRRFETIYHVMVDPFVALSEVAENGAVERI